MTRLSKLLALFILHLLVDSGTSGPPDFPATLTWANESPKQSYRSTSQSTIGRFSAPAPSPLLVFFGLLEDWARVDAGIPRGFLAQGHRGWRHSRPP